jgi:hypothetical protein
MSAGDSTYDERAQAPIWSAAGPVPRELKRAACRVFISYARVDMDFLARLEAHLMPMVREGLVEVWHDQVIKPGADWASDIEHHLDTADIVVLLVSADFVASVFCFEKELTEALRRHRDEGVRILPVIIKPVDFKQLAFARFDALPRNIQPISTWDNLEAAWLDVALGVRTVVEDIHGSRASLPAQRISSPEETQRSSLGQQLVDYYGRNNCVVDGRVREDGHIEWVPLDGNSSNMRFDNLVPLSRRHRVRRTSFRFGFGLTAENLLHRSRQHFHEGSPALAFGCARLGDALTDRYPGVFETPEDDGWAFLSLCLIYLPYRMHLGLLEAGLRRVRYRITHATTCPADRRATLLLSVANLYQDLGGWPRAHQLYGRVLRSRPTNFTEAATRRRRAIGRLFSGSSDQVDDELRRIAEYKLSVDFQVSLAVARGWWRLARGRPEECLHMLEPVDFEDAAESAAYSPHNAFEVKLTQVSALDALGLSNRSQIQLVQQLAQRWPHTRLRPVFTDQIAPKILGPQFAHVIKPLGSGLLTTPSLVTELDATASALLAVPEGDV